MNKVEKIIMFSTLAVVLALVTFGFVSSVNSNNEPEPVVNNNYKLNVAAGEELAVAKARQAIAQSTVDGEGVIERSDCSIIGDMAKKAESQASWFADCSKVKYGSTPDNDSEEVLMLSDSDYCATLKFTVGGQELKHYTFNEGECGDTSIAVK